MEDVVKALIELGLTELEAKILVALQKHNNTTAKDLSVTLDVHRQQIYPALNELHKAGLVTERLGRPSQFKTLPIDQIFAILLDRKSKWVSEMEKKTAEITKNFSAILRESSEKVDYAFELITGKERVKSALYEWEQSARTTDSVLKFDPLMRHITEELEVKGIRHRKNIETRIVTDATEAAIKSWPTRRNQKIKFVSYRIPVEMVIYNKERAHMAVYPDRNISAAMEVAVLTSNHPCFVGMLQNYFDVLWEAAKEKPN
ncbi:MAG: hypothetical protein NWF00_10590 [Candidatus Bathyarchaeota archaeon]|nr:hypothetical protein [Candidatus Bathyarchaeota archaeon]